MEKPNPTEEEEEVSSGDDVRSMDEAGTTENKPLRQWSKPRKWICRIGLGVIVVVAAVVAPITMTNKTEKSKKHLANQAGVNGGAPTPPLRASATPSDVPSAVPSDVPSAAPSTPYPSAYPTGVPSTVPSDEPSDIPTIVPSSAPTVEEIVVEPNPVPANPRGSYFNYDPTDSRYGPNAWTRVDTSDNYLREFGSNGWGTFRGHFERNPRTNSCGRTGRMSPQDLRQTENNDEAICDASHQIRTKPGRVPLSDDSIIKRIESNKLRLVLNRRSCLGVRDDRFDCNDGPPSADYPRYSSFQTQHSDLLNLDIKVPGEHWIEGESFDAEIQMLHTHVTDQRVSSIGIPIRATVGGFNAEFQEILDQFQLVYDFDLATCNAATLNRRRAASQFYSELIMKGEEEGDAADEDDEDQEWEQDYSTPLDDPDFIRRLQRPGHRFNPYTEAFLTTVYFFRYNGSTTEPPCYPLTWWVMIKPMIISFEQLNQIKYLLFTHVDGNCEKTSVHNADQSVARPLQTLARDRFIMKCGEGTFESDVEKGKVPPLDGSV